jgi:hypothetical protein
MGERGMARLTAIAVALPLIIAAPAAAQRVDAAETKPLSLFTEFSENTPLQIDRRGFSFPVIEYTEPNGSRARRRGIIAGTEVARGTLLGIGFFESMPRTRGLAPELSGDGTRKPKRRAAVGLSIRF